MKLPKKFKVTKKRVVILAVVLTAILAGYFFIFNKPKNEISSANVEKGVVREELILTGSVMAEKHALLSFPTSGKISWVGVSEGQKVYRGQALTSLDKTTLNTTYQQALNTYRDKQASAENTLDTVKDNSDDESFSQKATRTTAEVARDNAYDAVTAARYNLNNATLLAPFAGIVSSLPFTSPGVNVSAADTQVEIVDPATIYFEVDADQTDVTKIKEDQEVIVVLDTYSDKELKGKVSFIAYTPKSGEAGTVYKVKVKFDTGAFGEVLPRIGMTGDAKFVLSEKSDVLYVPSEFVNSDVKGKFLKLGKSNNKTYVETGIENEESVEIKSEKVKEGDVVYD
jgi:RND family efflux transporter MFP subunit